MNTFLTKSTGKPSQKGFALVLKHGLFWKLGPLSEKQGKAGLKNKKDTQNESATDVILNSNVLNNPFFLKHKNNNWKQIIKKWHEEDRYRQTDPHSEHRFPAPSSKLCQI